MNQIVLPLISTAIREATHRPFDVHAATPIGGGSINETFRLEATNGERYFLKLNDARHHSMFEAEAAGLETIIATNTLRVPQPVAFGIAGERSYLVLEYLELRPRGNSGLLGELLAAMHRCGNDRFGYIRDNFIGTTPQPNAWKESWFEFWRERRLGFQLRVASNNDYGSQIQSLGEKLLVSLPAFFAGYTPEPSLLHGDLWGGNHAFLPDGTPVIFDPAPYYGDRECDIAMTELFGGFPASFYSSYRAAWPLDSGYEHRRDLYNLYHVLNHANLFGGGYVQQAKGIMQRLLSETG